MAGLVPAIHAFLRAIQKKDVDARHKAGHDDNYLPYSFTSCLDRGMGGFVYIVTDRRNGTLYAGVTSNLPRRAYEHRHGLIDGFTKRYGLKQLVWFELHDDIRTAIQKEKTMKHWPRAWKARLINASNPDWNDLTDTLT